MEEEQSEIAIPTFMKKSHRNSVGMAAGVVHSHKSLHVFRRSRRRRWRAGSTELKRQQIKEASVKNEENKNGGGCTTLEEKEGSEEKKVEDEKEEIERKIHALQRIVPGGESFSADKLFDETASYIVALQYQVKALRALTGFIEKLEKEKSKFGG